ncbi:MAG: CMP-2-keto-3-deoxyoctulosonic acid synthetase [Coriobacteriia bacterium]|nr:CMP-2-keto-3-deoxyoctulosonic acid synthetase [Coriobacteriia bacterium]
MGSASKNIRNTVIAAVSAAAVVVAIAAATVVAPTFAVADRSSGEATTFGIGKSTASLTASVANISETDATAAYSEAPLAVTDTAETSVLATSVNYDVMVGVNKVEERREAERRAAEEAERRAQQEKIDQAAANEAAWRAMGDGAVNAVGSVDFSVGKEAFIAEWGARIDAYLSHSVLAGYGETFAAAAWEYGVDPRWSPAISNTESGNGFNCFLPHNAWGWGSSSWSSWSEAINAHVAGLASAYGYSITYAFAAKYCPPNTQHWYNNTISQMQLI